MDQIAKEFLDYLIYIGLITNESIKSFILQLKNKINSSDKLKFILRNALFSYLNNLSEYDIKSISFTITNTFFTNKIKANEHIIENLLNIYEKSQLLTYQEYINKWYTLTFNYDINKILKFQVRENILDEINNNSILIDNLIGIENTINNKHKRGFSHRNLSRNIQSFNQNGSNLNFSNIKKNPSNNNSKSIVNDFISRQNDYIKNSSIKRAKLKQLNEDEYELLCTFSPKIIGKSIENNYTQSNSNIYKKLYEDSSRRQITYNKKLKDYVKNIKNESKGNFSSKGNINHSKKFFNKEKLEKLYNDFKTKSNVRRKLKNKINYENGITFKPNLSKTPDYIKKGK